jgi:hypothetical protein
LLEDLNIPQAAIKVWDADPALAAKPSRTG